MMQLIQLFRILLIRIDEESPLTFKYARDISGVIIALFSLILYCDDYFNLELYNQLIFNTSITTIFKASIVFLSGVFGTAITTVRDRQKLHQRINKLK